MSRRRKTMAEGGKRTAKVGGDKGLLGREENVK